MAAYVCALTGTVTRWDGTPVRGPLHAPPRWLERAYGGQAARLITVASHLEVANERARKR